MNEYFESAVQEIYRRDPRYSKDAYEFMRGALDFTVKKLRRGTLRRSSRRHVSASELLDGIRDYALQLFGPLTVEVFRHWGVSSCRDFGNIVFNLIEAKVFGASENDRIEDFENGYDFAEAFEKPFLPQKPLHIHKHNRAGRISTSKNRGHISRSQKSPSQP